MDSDAFSEDSDASEVGQMRLAHPDDSSQNEDNSRDEPDTISDAEVFQTLKFKSIDL